VARTSRRTARPGGVDPHDEPSAQWGWHGTFPNGQRIAGVVVAVVLLVLVIGPYQSRLQDFWIVAIALGLLALIVRGTMKRRNDWRK
jgi:drug/metabolite transporter (DMT)-like permease